MKTMYFMCLAFVFVALVGCQSTLKPGRQHDQFLDRRVSMKNNYLLYLPRGYGEKEKKWPMILFLHGAGERGDDLAKVKAHGPAKIVEAGKDLPFIVVSPQCPAKQWWPAKVEVLMGLLDEIEEKYDVDPQRFYLTGLSMGGYGSWSLAAMYPDRFAAVVPICGGGMPYLGRNFKNLPVWAFHGAKDEVVPLQRSQEMVDAINAAGGNAKLTVYPDAGHDSWTETYDNPELYEWFLRHRRKNPNN
jgi:predicted peptidase